MFINLPNQLPGQTYNVNLYNDLGEQIIPAVPMTETEPGNYQAKVDVPIETKTTTVSDEDKIVVPPKTKPISITAKVELEDGYVAVGSNAMNLYAMDLVKVPKKLIEPRCPYCFSKLHQGINPLEFKWTDDPTLVQGAAIMQQYKGFMQICPKHITELQENRNYLEEESGLELTEFTEVDNEFFYQLYATYIKELRESTERLLDKNGITKEEYFNYDDEGNKLGVGQQEWIDENIDLITQVKALHIEDLRHYIRTGMLEQWKSTGDIDPDTGELKYPLSDISLFEHEQIVPVGDPDNLKPSTASLGYWYEYRTTFPGIMGGSSFFWDWLTLEGDWGKWGFYYSPWRKFSSCGVTDYSKVRIDYIRDEEKPRDSYLHITGESIALSKGQWFYPTGNADCPGWWGNGTFAFLPSASIRFYPPFTTVRKDYLYNLNLDKLAIKLKYELTGNPCTFTNTAYFEGTEKSYPFIVISCWINVPGPIPFEWNIDIWVTDNPSEFGQTEQNYSYIYGRNYHQTTLIRSFSNIDEQIPLLPYISQCTWYSGYNEQYPARLYFWNFDTPALMVYLPVMQECGKSSSSCSKMKYDWKINHVGFVPTKLGE
jgi:hypothetical protein